MERRDFIKNIPITVAALGSTGSTVQDAADLNTARAKKLSFTVAHITDVHIRPDENIPERFIKCLNEIKSKKVDFFLNGGDSIHAADYNDITRERVLEQWETWDKSIRSLQGFELYSCIGNHDTWWAAPDKNDEMYGVNYAAKRVGMPHRYYSFVKGKWKFVILDGNNKGITLDPEQMAWLKKELENTPVGSYVLLMSHYPILTVTASWEGGQHKDHMDLKQLFYQHRDKVKVCLSGHQHLLDRAWYNGVNYFCNGAMSGFWWGKGDAKSAREYYYQETPPGYAILKLYDDGTVENEYFIHNY